MHHTNYHYGNLNKRKNKKCKFEVLNFFSIIRTKWHILLLAFYLFEMHNIHKVVLIKIFRRFPHLWLFRFINWNNFLF